MIEPEADGERSTRQPCPPDSIRWYGIRRRLSLAIRRSRPWPDPDRFRACAVAYDVVDAHADAMATVEDANAAIASRLERHGLHGDALAHAFGEVITQIERLVGRPPRARIRSTRVHRRPRAGRARRTRAARPTTARSTADPDPEPEPDGAASSSRGTP